MEINCYMEGLLLNTVQVTVDNQDKVTIGYEKHYKEDQHQTHYIVKPQVQDNNYVIKYINYIPT